MCVCLLASICTEGGANVVMGRKGGGIEAVDAFSFEGGAALEIRLGERLGGGGSGDNEDEEGGEVVVV